MFSHIHTSTSLQPLNICRKMFRTVGGIISNFYFLLCAFLCFLNLPHEKKSYFYNQRNSNKSYEIEKKKDNQSQPVLRQNHWNQSTLRSLFLPYVYSSFWGRGLHCLHITTLSTVTSKNAPKIRKQLSSVFTASEVAGALKKYCCLYCTMEILIQLAWNGAQALVVFKAPQLILMLIWGWKRLVWPKRFTLQLNFTSRCIL